jgi:DNA polymerase elongation subunit (family B)
VNILYGLRILHPKPDPLNYITKLLLNSLYGRFGMEDSFADFLILDNKSYTKFEKDPKNNLLNVVPLGDKFLIKHRPLDKDINTFLDNATETHNVSIGIAAAITAYARIHMSQFKNNPNFILYYSDTDSIYIDRPLPDEFISSTILGKMKLEYICNKAIFLAPKVYYLETVDGKVIYKVKGLKHEVELTLNDFESLLYKDTFIKKVQNV